GIGMNPEAASRIFEDFVQADASVTRKFGGTGLGLSISRKFAQALGGNITLESAIGKGSVFHVTLDGGPSEGVRWVSPEDTILEDESHLTQEDHHWIFPQAKILVVDDGPENREFVKVVLAEYGLQVDEAANGRIAVEMVSTRDYDVILMDVQMPDMDGPTATRTLREHGCRTPIVA
ncbi:MAG: response regulator, partial [Nitrospira sp.]|nr:response regulator [Nitrospira sp.]